jgi:IS30 family transposase
MDWAGDSDLRRCRASRCLSVGEREEISRGLACGDSCRQIAVCVGRSRTTICREVNRNGGREGLPRSGRRSGCMAARSPPPARKLAINAPLRAVVEEKLRLDWSPQHIAGWRERTYPDGEAMRIWHETIYLDSQKDSCSGGRRVHRRALLVAL